MYMLKPYMEAKLLKPLELSVPAYGILYALIKRNSPQICEVFISSPIYCQFGWWISLCPSFPHCVNIYCIQAMQNGLSLPWAHDIGATVVVCAEQIVSRIYDRQPCLHLMGFCQKRRPPLSFLMKVLLHHIFPSCWSIVNELVPSCPHSFSC